MAPQAFQAAVALPPGVPADRIRILGKAFEALAQDQAYQKDYQKVIGQPADALVGNDAVKVVDGGLKQLFDLSFKWALTISEGYPKANNSCNRGGGFPRLCGGLKFITARCLLKA